MSRDSASQWSAARFSGSNGVVKLVLQCYLLESRAEWRPSIIVNISSAYHGSVDYSYHLRVRRLFVVTFITALRPLRLATWHASSVQHHPIRYDTRRYTLQQVEPPLQPSVNTYRIVAVAARAVSETCSRLSTAAGRKESNKNCVGIHQSGPGVRCARVTTSSLSAGRCNFHSPLQPVAPGCLGRTHRARLAGTNRRQWR